MKLEEAKRLENVLKSNLNKISNYEIFKLLCESREAVVKLFNDYSSITSEAKGLKIVTPSQMLQRLPMALAQVKAGNTSETLLKEIRQIIYSLYIAKEITRKVYNNIINSIKA